MSNRIDFETRQMVASRANFVCEYCLVAEEDAYFKFQIEHIISRKHGGTSTLENLALACVFCNRYKGSDIATLSPETGELVGLYHPRTHNWTDHFYLDEVVIEPLTDIGEATVRILQMNHNDQLLEREILSRSKRYPSDGAVLLISER